MSKHTPGPWWQEGVSICVDGMDVARVYQSHKSTEEEFKANAYLIAAAPDLLEALEELRRKFVEIVDGEWGGDIGEKWLPESCDAAIAKATQP